jgi:exopolysaccharide production protein ExoQ
LRAVLLVTLNGIVSSLKQWRERLQNRFAAASAVSNCLDRIATNRSRQYWDFDCLIALQFNCFIVLPYPRRASIRARMLSPSISNTLARTIAPSRSPDGNLLMHFCFAFGLIFLMPAFIMQLAVVPGDLTFTTSRTLQVANLFCGAYGIAMILTSRQVTGTMLRCWPILLLVGLAFASSVWSTNPASTIRQSPVLVTTSAFAMAMAGRLSPATCYRLIIRTMALVCLLSVLWVVLFPQQGMHQATDPFQYQHAGLWRGIFTHKQGLGVTSGLTTGLLLFYGSMTFSSLLFRLGAIACSVMCLVGTMSATGFVIAIALPIMLYTTYWIARRPPSVRKGMMALLVVTITAGYACFHLGILDFVMPMIGKSTDLSGRADFWPWVLANIKNSGSALLGGGFAGGWESVVAPDVSIDSGYILLVVWFGYLGAAIVLAVHGWVLWAGAKLIFSARSETAAILVFPFCIMMVEFILNITETAFMGKNINTVLVTVAAYQIVRYQSAVRTRTAWGSTNKIAPQWAVQKAGSERSHF